MKAKEVLLLESEGENADDDTDYDLFDMESQDSYLEPYMRKVIKRLFHHINNTWSRAEITETVVNYCFEHPEQKNINQLVQIIQNQRSSQPPSSTTAQNKVDLTLPEDKRSSAPTIYVDDDDVEIVTPLSSKQVNPMVEVLRIFPDVKRSYLEHLLFKNANDYIKVVQLMSEHGYEKDGTNASPTSQKRKSSVLKKRKLEEKYDFTASSWETSERYRSEALTELTHNFPFLTVASIPKTFAHRKYHYYHTVRFLEEVTGEKPRLRSHPIPLQLPLKYPKHFLTSIQQHLLQHSQANTFLKTRQSVRILPTLAPIEALDEIFALELEFLEKQRTQALLAQDLKMAIQINQQLAEEENALFECQCCYNDEYPFEEMVQCTEGDLFCKTCLQRYVEEMIFGKGSITTHTIATTSGQSIPNHQMHIPCMNSTGTACPGFFTEYMIEKSLPPKVLEKYTETIIQENIAKAQLSNNMVKCYSCELLYEKPENNHSLTILHCMACNSDTCLACGEVSHIPLKCTEVEKATDTAKRITLEEAMATARIRECPKCHKRFFKTEGCNKMTCACGTFICYLCRENITKMKYQHFCQTPHCNHQNCGKCLLYTNTVDDDRRAMLEAGLKVLQAEKGETSVGSTATTTTAMNSKSTTALLNSLDEETKLELEKLLEGGLTGLDGAVKGKKQPPMNNNNNNGPAIIPPNAGNRVRAAVARVAHRPQRNDFLQPLPRIGMDLQNPIPLQPQQVQQALPLFPPQTQVIAPGPPLLPPEGNTGFLARLFNYRDLIPFQTPLPPPQADKKARR